jgi:hypothetical protein
VLFYPVLAFLLAMAAPFTGAQACAKCHPAQFQAQSSSRHALALRPAGKTNLVELLNARPLRERSGVEYSYSATANGVRVSITQGRSQTNALLEWAFGAGAQAITPVGRHNGRYFEHRISWYREPGHAARTLGHLAAPSAGPIEALGIPQSDATITRCFQCHATAVGPGPDLSVMQPGVTCERCHGPGRAHVENPSTANITRLSRLSAAKAVEFCAGCHRSDAALSDPATVRFQPVGLAASRCFKQSGALSCTTCHDPHSDVSTDSSFYVQRCLGCHESSNTPARNCRRGERSDCLPCHMKRQTPFEFLTFTDHRIRVY